MSHLFDTHKISRRSTPIEFSDYFANFGEPNCACGCGLKTSLHCKKLQYNLFANGCHNKGRFINISCPEFHLFKGKSVDETIDAIRKIQKKVISDKHRKQLSVVNTNNNPMSVKSIAKRTGMSVDRVAAMLSEKNSGPSNGFYKKKHHPDTLAKLAVARAKQCKTVTSPELIVYGILSGLDISFVYQHPINRYVVDFFVNEDIVIEVYGNYWHGDRLKSGSTKKCDADKENKLRGLGYNVFVFWESEILKNTPDVVARIKKCVSIK
jgi:very-short-patch-repair endonuclease